MLDNSIKHFADLKQDLENFLSTDADVTLTVSQRVVHVTGFSAAVEVQLPQVVDAAGLIFSIKVLDDASINNVTIVDQDESRSWADLTCSNAAGGRCLLYSDGETWSLIQATNVA